MPPRLSLYSRRTLALSLVLVLGGGFLATSLISYYASRHSIRDSIVNTELPLTSDTVYSEIQKDLVRPILISSMMARDTFLRDWVISGERDPERMTRYLQEVMKHNGAYTAFFVSEHSLIYYQAKGILKHIAPDAPRDVWYYRVRDMDTPYEINVDLDMANHDSMTVFINYKVHDYNGRFIGAAGVGLTVDAVIRLIDRYQERYQRSVYFVDKQGRVVLTGSAGAPGSVRAGQTLAHIPDMNQLLAELAHPASGQYEYVRPGSGHYLNVRFIPELDWYLFVDKHESRALGDLHRTLWMNLGICTLVTGAVILLLMRVMGRYQRRIESLASLDSLTQLSNRRGFDPLATQALATAERHRSPLAALLLDLDHFKQLNDRHGHLAGDAVLAGFAGRLRDCLRRSDLICRWGGEEFIVLLPDTPVTDALHVAENIRRHTAEHAFGYADEALQVTVSIGLAMLQPHDTLYSLIARADQALYQAKQSGRNCVRGEHPRPEHA